MPCRTQRVIDHVLSALIAVRKLTVLLISMLRGSKSTPSPSRSEHFGHNPES